MKRLLNIFLLFIVLFFFTGCVGVRNTLEKFTDKIAKKTPQKTPEGTKALISSSYLKKALEYEKDNELQTALFYMQIAGTLDPNNTEIPEKIAGLKSTIDKKAGHHFTKGVSFYKKRKLSDALRQFLTALRYAPGHKDAFDYLKNRLPPEEYINYKVKNKDTFKGIAKKFYNDPSKDFLIAYFNNLKTDKKPVPGTMLELPILGSKFARPSISARPSIGILNELTKAENLLKEKRYQKVLDVLGKINKHDLLNKKASDLNNAACYQIGIELSRQEKYPEAIEMFKKVAPEYQGVKEAMQQAVNKELMKAKNFLKQKQYEQTLAVASKILDYDESNKKAKDLINTTFCEKAKDLIVRKNYSQAVKVLDKADPEHFCVKKTVSDVNKTMKKLAEVHYLKGVKYFLNEELESAIKEWEKTLTLNPEHKKAKKNTKNAHSLLEKLKKVK